jgi:hypothetical protein
VCECVCECVQATGDELKTIQTRTKKERRKRRGESR